MPGCSSQVWSEITLLLSPIAARDFRGHPCVTHIGSGASGNYVKMVHNGIEYAVMQMIAEAYETFRTIYGMSAPEIAEIFARYNTGVLDSYLIEITSKILSQKDSLTDGYLIDHIADHAGAKGTGLWTSIDALESGNSVSAIVEATFARMVSEKKPLRTTLASLYPRERSIKIPKEQMIAKMESTLYLGMLFAYAQGLALIRDRSLEYGW
jgi:6-phosphogluconate dehydrogenase